VSGCSPDSLHTERWSTWMLTGWSLWCYRWALHCSLCSLSCLQKRKLNMTYPASHPHWLHNKWGNILAALQPPVVLVHTTPSQMAVLLCKRHTMDTSTVYTPVIYMSCQHMRPYLPGLPHCLCTTQLVIRSRWAGDEARIWVPPFYTSWVCLTGSDMHTDALAPPTWMFSGFLYQSRSREQEVIHQFLQMERYRNTCSWQQGTQMSHCQTQPTYYAPLKLPLPLSLTLTHPHVHPHTHTPTYKVYTHTHTRTYHAQYIQVYTSKTVLPPHTRTHTHMHTPTYHKHLP